MLTASAASMACLALTAMSSKTRDQQPNDSLPAGGCDPGAGSCYDFPVVKQAVDLSTPIATLTPVVLPLVNFADGNGTAWSDTFANQIVGVQWQFTGTNIDADDGCPIDVSITNVKFQ